MTARFTHVSVLGPRNLTTGGAEVLHQLVFQLRELGQDASMVYFDADPGPINPAYQQYLSASGELIDEPGACVIVPETLTGATRKIVHASSVVWWLSVDNYFAYKPSKLGRIRNSLLNTKFRPEPLHMLHHCLHFAQSEYARLFLETNGLTCELLSDFLDPIHFLSPITTHRLPRIAVNPKKGSDVIHNLRNHFPDLNFIELSGMTPTELRESLAGSMIYADFGHHPGKDRIPREAAMAGSCVIVGRKGSAANQIDLPIPTEFRLDESQPDFLERFRLVVDQTFADFGCASVKFDDYRTQIRGEAEVFKEQVRRIFSDNEDVEARTIAK